MEEVEQQPEAGGSPTGRRAQSSRRSRRPARAERGGIRYGGGISGKYIFRVRERHVAEHLAPLIRRKAVGAAKLDLVLRGIALLPAHARSREPGIVLPRYGYVQLHDLARKSETLGSDEPGFDPPPEVVKLKRKWVGRQLDYLEELGLVRREPRQGKRPQLIVLRDDGSGASFDDPDGRGANRYITVRGGVIASRALAGWGAPQLAAYLAATVAERYDTVTQRSSDAVPGAGRWFRALDWFADPERRFGNEDRRRIPFSVPTLERGLTLLRSDGLVEVQHTTINPATRRRLQSQRNIYYNHFNALDDAAQLLDPDEYTAEVEAEEDGAADSASE